MAVDSCFGQMPPSTLCPLAIPLGDSNCHSAIFAISQSRFLPRGRSVLAVIEMATVQRYNQLNLVLSPRGTMWQPMATASHALLQRRCLVDK